MGISWVNHKENTVLYIDVANLENDYDSLKAELSSLVVLLQKEPKNSVLAVADLRNTYLSNNALLTLMSNAPLAAPYFQKSALVIEPNRARRVILDTIGQFIGHIPKDLKILKKQKTGLLATRHRDNC